MVTLSDFFLAGQADLAGRIKDALAKDGVAVKTGAGGTLPMLGWRMMPKAIAGQLSTLLDIGLPDILIGGWNKAYALRQHLQKSAKTPGKETFLQLAEHKITSNHEPYVALLKNGKEVARLPFSISIELVLQSAVLRILDGEIREIQTGQIKAKGSVKCGGAILIQKDFQPVKVPGTMEVGAKPIELRLSA
jgi:hypothetical protein